MENENEDFEELIDLKDLESLTDDEISDLLKEIREGDENE